MNNSEKICLSLALGVGAINFLVKPHHILFVILLIFLFSFVYFINHLFYINAHKDIAKGILVSFFFLLIALIPFIGIIIFIGFILYNVAKTMESLKQLVPEIMFSIAIYLCLLSPIIFSMTSLPMKLIPASIYAVLVIAYCKRLTHLETRDGLFLFSLMWLSVPLAVLMLVSIINALASMLKISIGSLSRNVISSQNVGAHIRAGSLVSGYTRNVASTVTESVVNLMPGAGGVTSSITKEVADKIVQKNNK